jgi:hypothetical protein
MRKEFEEIVKTLQIEDLSTAELRKRVLTLCSDVDNARTIITEIERISIGTTNHDNQPFYSLFLACAYHESGEGAMALDYARRAVNQFKMCDSCQGWNEAMAHWMLGELYRDTPNQNGCYQELQNAEKILKNLALEFQLKGFYDDSRHIQDFLLKRLDEMINLPYHSQEGPPGSHSQMDSNGYLVLPWIPVYQHVRAGQSGIIEFSAPPPDGRIEVQSFILDDQRFVLHYLRQQSPQDRQIRLTNAGGGWGLAKVRGDSMNAINRGSPINSKPIMDGDYVLFRKQPDGDEGDIVIASNPRVQTGEFPYVVKRYRKTEGLLYSETTRTGKEYEPIELNKDTQILAVVYAVAKPTI